MTFMVDKESFCGMQQIALYSPVCLFTEEENGVVPLSGLTLPSHNACVPTPLSPGNPAVWIYVCVCSTRI